MSATSQAVAAAAAGGACDDAGGPYDVVAVMW